MLSEKIVYLKIQALQNDFKDPITFSVISDLQFDHQVYEDPKCQFEDTGRVLLVNKTESPVELRLYPLGYFPHFYFGKAFQKVPIGLTSLNPKCISPLKNHFQLAPPGFPLGHVDGPLESSYPKKDNPGEQQWTNCGAWEREDEQIPETYWLQNSCHLLRFKR